MAGKRVNQDPFGGRKAHYSESEGISKHGEGTAFSPTRRVEFRAT